MTHERSIVGRRYPRPLRVDSTKLTLVVLYKVFALCFDEVESFLLDKGGHVERAVGLCGNQMKEGGREGGDKGGREGERRRIEEEELWGGRRKQEERRDRRREREREREKG